MYMPFKLLDLLHKLIVIDLIGALFAIDRSAEGVARTSRPRLGNGAANL
jgi:hypothetical protein